MVTVDSGGVSGIVSFGETGAGGVLGVGSISTCSKSSEEAGGFLCPSLHLRPLLQVCIPFDLLLLLL